MNYQVDSIYADILNILKQAKVLLTPYVRRFLRFIALPYYYFFVINWKLCTSSRLNVIADLLYIFFRLKYYPDNYSQCRLWELNRDEWQYYYGSIYNPYNRARLRKNIQRSEYIILFDDKEVCFDLCQSGNLPLPMQYAIISPSDDHQMVISDVLKRNRLDRLIMKPTRGRGGADIYYILRKEGNIVVKWSDEKNQVVTGRLEDIRISRRSVLQEAVVQHERLAAFSPSSVNTVRLVTFLTLDKSVILLGGFLRLGVHDSFVDNTSKGGLGVGIDVDNGRLREFAYDQKGNKFSHHPVSGIKFNGYQIPKWDKISKLAEETQKYFFYYGLLGIDMAITANEPVILEINSSYDNVGLEQKCGGILKNKMIYQHFKENDLLLRKIDAYEAESW